MGYSVNTILSTLRDVVTERMCVEHVAARSVDVSSVVLDIDKLQSLISFSPRNIKEGITRFYQDVKNGK